MTEAQRTRYLEVIDSRLKSLSHSIEALPSQAKGFKRLYDSLMAERNRVAQ